MSFKAFLQNLWVAITNIFVHADAEVRNNILPAVSSVVNVLKSIKDFDQDDVIVAIAGAAGEQLSAKVAEILPEIIAEITLSEGDINSKLKAVSESSVAAKNAFYHSVAALLTEELSDGKLSWSEAVILTEYYYQNGTEPVASEEVVEEEPVVSENLTEPVSEEMELAVGQPEGEAESNGNKSL